MHMHTHTHNELHLKGNPWNLKDTGQGLATEETDIVWYACVQYTDIWHKIEDANKIVPIISETDLYSFTTMDWGTRVHLGLLY